MLGVLDQKVGKLVYSRLILLWLHTVVLYQWSGRCWLGSIHKHVNNFTFRKSKNGSRHKFKASAWDSWKTSGCRSSRMAKAFTKKSLCCLFLNSLGVRWARPLSNQPSWGSCRSMRAGWRMATLRQRRAALVILLWWLWDGPESAIAVSRWCSSVSSYSRGDRHYNHVHWTLDHV